MTRQTEVDLDELKVQFRKIQAALDATIERVNLLEAATPTGAVNNASIEGDEPEVEAARNGRARKTR
jgi:hypothetical protein